MLHASYVVHAFTPTSKITSTGPASAVSALTSAFRLSRARYVCQPMAITPENTLRYSIGINVKLKAVTMGQKRHELTTLVGTVLTMRSRTPEGEQPARKAWAPKK